MLVSSTSGRSAARLNEVGRATVDDAREFVRPYAEQFPQIYSNYGFDARLPERKLIWISIHTSADISASRHPQRPSKTQEKVPAIRVLPTQCLVRRRDNR
jgi:hypothetical protein